MRTRLLASAFALTLGLGAAQAYDQNDLPPACAHPTEVQKANANMMHYCDLMMSEIKAEENRQALIKQGKEAVHKTGEALKTGWAKGVGFVKEKIKEHDGK